MFRRKLAGEFVARSRDFAVLNEAERGRCCYSEGEAGLILLVIFFAWAERERRIRSFLRVISAVVGVEEEAFRRHANASR